MALHEAALTDAQLRALTDAAGVASKESFYLAGGAALALWFGHRRSVDLDWFRRRRIVDPLELARGFTDAGVAFDVTTNVKGTLHGVANGVKMSFLEYPYKMLARPTKWKEAGCALASREDLACMKLSAMADRGAKKDFIDLYFLGQEIPLARMLELYQTKYGVSDIAHLVVALAYFDDAERQRMPQMIRKVSWTAVKAEIRGWIRRL